MSQERRNFDKEFKLMTVELSKSRESIQELAKELGIRAELIYRWRPEYLEKPEGSFTGHGKPRHTPEEAEIARLKKQLRDVEMERDILKKGHQHLLQGRREIYRFIACQSSRFPVDKMCEVLKVSRSGYYSSLKGTVSKRAKENQELLSLIKQEHKKSRQRYGSPRISQALRANQVQVSRPRVARLMKQAQIKARMVKRFRVSTDSK
ncbi:transposase-like protein, partial [Pontibacter ummariensis]